MELSEWNGLSSAEAAQVISVCCGSRRWASAMTSGRPYHDEAVLFEAARMVWGSLGEEDWLEAFASHPKIGDKVTTAWSLQEQSSMASADAHTKEQLSSLNAEYEQRFGFIYIVCATGKSPEEMVAILRRRLNNAREEELHEAARQLEQIMNVRLRKWLAA